MRYDILICVLFTLLVPTKSAPVPGDNAVGVVWTFPNETWIENLAVRQNGEILATSLSRNAVYLVDPFEHTATTVHQFGPGNGVLGIAEIENDIFALATADINLKTSSATKGSNKIWRLDMTAWNLNEADSVTLASNLTNATLVDGVVALSEPGLILVADAFEGVVWRVDTKSGDYNIAIADNSFKIANPAIPLGVDGIHIADGFLYFTNFGSNTFGKVSIDSYGTATGPVEIVTAGLLLPDDFAIVADGTSFVAGGNTLWKVTPDGSVKVLAGGANDTTLEGVTSAQFARTRADTGVLYLGTNGGMFQPVDGIIHGGEIVAINVGV